MFSESEWHRRPAGETEFVAVLLVSHHRRDAGPTTLPPNCSL